MGNRVLSGSLMTSESPWPIGEPLWPPFFPWGVASEDIDPTSLDRIVQGPPRGSACNVERPLSIKVTDTPAWWMASLGCPQDGKASQMQVSPLPRPCPILEAGGPERQFPEEIGRWS